MYTGVEKSERKKVVSRQRRKVVKNTRVGTWNIHGKLQDPLHQELQQGDMVPEQADMCCLQEA